MNPYLSHIFEKKFFMNFLFLILFFSFIAGNLAINLNILLILIFGLAFYKLDVFKINYTFLDKLIFFTFFYILLNGIYNNYFYKSNNLTADSTVLIKSFLFLRFLLLYFLINFLIKKDIINLKIFFITSSVAVIFVSLDLFYQFYFWL